MSVDNVGLASPQGISPQHTSLSRVADTDVRQQSALRPAVTWMLATAALMLPALWNGFPLVFADSGGYLLRPLEGTLELGRSALYGTFMATGLQLDFWPPVLVQAAITAAIFLLALRTHAFHVGQALAVILGLVVATSLPWFSSQLMPDIFAPLAVLGLYLLGFQRQHLRTAEAVGVAAVVAFAIGCHMAILAMALATLFVLLVLRAVAPRSVLRPGSVAAPATAVGCGLVLALVSNLVIAGSFSFTPGGSSFLFGRLVKDGIVARYLADKCPDPTLSLCPYRHELPATGDDWLWQDRSPLQKLGGWDVFEPEANRIIADTLRRYPTAHIVTALRSTLDQLLKVETGEGMNPHDTWHVEWVLAQYAPHALARYRASGQYRDVFGFAAINRLHVPLALAASALLPFLLIALWRRQRPAAALCLTVLLALLANAAICGIFAGPTFRYQGRLMPLAVLAIVIGAVELRRAAPLGQKLMRRGDIHQPLRHP